MNRRSLGATDISVSTVAMGCWPIAGMTSLDVNDEDSLATLTAAHDAGVNFFDTAFCYGRDGESERLIAQAFRACRDDIVIATKGGIHWAADGSRAFGGTAECLQKELDVSLQRLQTDRVELYYLHAPDPDTDVLESAAAMLRFVEQGKVRAIGVSNFNLEQLQAFHQVCPISAFQPAYNMLQREIETQIVPWCRQNDVSIVVYWPLLKGLLAGKLSREHQFDPKDGRAKYPMFQGREWQRNQDLIDDLWRVANSIERPLSEMVVNWTISQPGITSALCGAKRPYQIQETAAAMTWELSDEHRRAIDLALERRGTPVTISAV